MKNLVDLTKLKLEVAKLEKSISESPYKVEESRAAAEKIRKVFSSKNMQEAFEELGAKKFEKLTDASQLANDIDQLRRFQETLRSELVKVETRYVISNKTLLSPAGFHPDSRVYVKNEVFIMTNELPKSVQNLLVFDLEKDS